MVIVSQETFDDAVKENINDLGLTPDEAVKEAIEQFKTQGADLSKVVTGYVPEADKEVINKSIKCLKQLNKEHNTPEEYIEQLTALKQQCDKGVQFKLIAEKSGAYDVLLDTILHHDENKHVKKEALRTITSLMTKLPDLLNDLGTEIILSHLNKSIDPEIQKFTLKWTKECFIMHEMNRQKLFDLNILEKLTELLNQANSDVLREVLGVFRALVLDDDVRVEFGRGHEHAKIIANETLHSLIGLLNRFKTDEALINDLMLTLSALLVRAEFCKKVEDVGGIELIHDVMVDFLSSDKINRQCFKLIKALAGNDECKAHLIQKGLAPVIANSLNQHMGTVPTAASGLGAVAALCLRSPDNSKVLFEAGLPEVIVETMKKHPKEKSVQKSASWAVRNMVSRSRYQNQHYLDLGIEELLQKNLAMFRDFEYDTKAALRDLGCDVELKEEWTGKGGVLASEQAKKI